MRARDCVLGALLGLCGCSLDWSLQLECTPHRLCDDDSGSLCIEGDDGQSVCRPLLDPANACTHTYPSSLTDLMDVDVLAFGVVGQWPSADNPSSYGAPTTQAIEVAIDGINAGRGIPVQGARPRKLLAIACNEGAARKQFVDESIETPLYVSTSDEASQQDQATEGDRTITWWVAGGAALVLAAGLTCGALSAAEHARIDDMREDCESCTTSFIRSEQATGRALETSANVLFVVAGAAAAASVVLYVLEPSWSEPRVSVVPQCVWLG